MNGLERSWYQRFGWSWLLLPLTLVFAALSALRRCLYRQALLPSHRIHRPVLVVGNISVGGTGKTPMTLWLCQYLQQQGWRPGIISRGYGAKIKAPILVSLQDSAQVVGDEPLLLAQRSACPVVVCPDRVAAARYLLAFTDCNIVISDDGLQHYALKRDVEIVLIDGQRGLGNGLLLPAGPLRESQQRLLQADLVISSGQSSQFTPHVMALQVSAAEPLLPGSAALALGSQVTLVSGIGNPERFKSSALMAGYQVQACHFFPDHHAFTLEDLCHLEGPLLMTEKDAVKCRAFAKADWYILPLHAQLPGSVVQILDLHLQRLRSLYGV